MAEFEFLQAPHKRGAPRGADRVSSSSVIAEGYYPSDAQLTAIISTATASVQIALKKQLKSCGKSMSLWENLSRPAQTDLNQLPLLPRLKQDMPLYSFQVAAAATAAAAAAATSSHADDDDDLGDDGSECDVPPDMGSPSDDEDHDDDAAEGDT